MSKHHSHHQASRPDPLLGDDDLRDIATAAVVQRHSATAMAAMVATQGDTPAELLAEARFMLAQALWDAPPDRARDRGRAMMLAEQARDAFHLVGEDRAKDLADIEKWIREHQE